MSKIVEKSMKNSADPTQCQLYAQLVGNLWTMCDLWSNGERYTTLERLLKVKSRPKNEASVKRIKDLEPSDLDSHPIDEYYQRVLSEYTSRSSGAGMKGIEEFEDEDTMRVKGSARHRSYEDKDGRIRDESGAIKAVLMEMRCVEKDAWRLENDTLGSGNYSTVSKATLSGVSVAAKVFKSRNTSDSDFLREVRFLAGLTHPGIVNFRGYYEGENQMIMFMDLMRSSIYEEFLADGKQIEEAPLNVRIRWSLQLALTIDFLHSQGLVHRDINPKNVLLSDAFEVKLCDFTFVLPFETSNSRTAEHRSIKKAQKEILALGVPLHVGTTRYMAPEIAAKQKGEIDFEASDVWSLGHTILDILTGIKPYEDIESNSETLMEFLANKVKLASTQDVKKPSTYRDERTLNIIPGLENAPQDTLKRFLNDICKCFLIDPSLRPTAYEIAQVLANYERHIYTHAWIQKTSIVFSPLAKNELETFKIEPPSLSSLIHAIPKRGK